MRAIAPILAAILVQALETHAGPLHDATRQGDLTAIRTLTEAGADIDEVAMVTPLLMAALSGQPEVVRLILDLGADPDLASSAMGTPLHAAAQRGFTDIARLLLDAGADPDSRNSDAYTPLMVAALHNRPDVARTLIEAGADIDAVGVARSNSMGGNGRVTALHVASFNGENDVARVLRDHGAGPRPIDFDHAAVRKADPEMGRQLARQWCGSCHKIESEDENIIKPEMGLSLVGVMGRRIASREDYAYFPILSKTEGTWTPDRLYSFAAEPMLTIPGTRMRWNDGWTEQDVAHIVAYFASVAK